MKGLYFKLKQNGISDDLLNMLSDPPRNSQQIVMLNGQSFSGIYSRFNLQQ